MVPAGSVGSSEPILSDDDEDEEEDSSKSSCLVARIKFVAWSVVFTTLISVSMRARCLVNDSSW